MEKCKNCTLQGSPKTCFVQENEFLKFQCDFIDPTHLSFKEDYVENHKQRNGLTELPSTWNQLKNVAKSTVEFIKNDGYLVDDKIRNERLNICGSCPHLLENRCTECGCFVHAKASISTESCPINKWVAITTPKPEISVNEFSTCIPCNQSE